MGSSCIDTADNSANSSSQHTTEHRESTGRVSVLVVAPTTKGVQHSLCMLGWQIARAVALLHIAAQLQTKALLHIATQLHKVQPHQCCLQASVPILSHALPVLSFDHPTCCLAGLEDVTCWWLSSSTP